ncbi:MAG: SDR family oxidoreductase, partial [Candidatus Hydrogenedentes bacterium]|nr:SDR family oxidoreductase [Candidatus Hydrogenedentota bacterium]
EMLARERPAQVLVNNAGTNRLNPIDQVATQDLDALLSINLRAPLLLCREVGRTMKEARYGRIINIASIWSVITKPGRVVYTATKTGLAGMTKTVAADLAPYGVLVNAVSPGFINTELTKMTLPLEEQERLAAQVPLGRFAEPEEIARVVLFLASRENSYLTGQNIVVDGGFTCV